MISLRLRLFSVLLASIPAARCRQWYFFEGESSPFVANRIALPNDQHHLADPDEEAVEVADRTPDRSQHWRPQVHFTPPRNWMNDPNGLFLDSSGTWHMYYQYGDRVDGTSWRNWGHASSPDLYTWIDHPIAIPYNDKDGSIWSGSVVVDHHNVSGLFPAHVADNILAYYTSWTEPQEAQAIAYSVDGGISFTQFKHNPIIWQDRHNFRDPKISYHHPSKKWVMVLTYVNDVTFFVSENLLEWRQTSIWNPGRDLGWIECPQILEVPVRNSHRKVVGSKWMLVLSINGGGLNGAGVVKYILGDFSGEVFTPEKPDDNVDPLYVMRGADWAAYEIDFGPDKYGTAFFHFPSNDDAHHDAVSISWAIDIGTSLLDTPTSAEGWRHCMNGARQHWIDRKTNRLMSIPAGDTSVLATDMWNPLVDMKAVSGVEGQSTIIRENNPAMEFLVTIRLPKGLLQGRDTATASLKLKSTDSGDEETLSLTMDFSVGDDGPVGKFTMARQGQQWWKRQGYWSPTDPLKPMPSASDAENATTVEFEIRGFIDRSILEVYLNGGVEAGTMLYFTKGVLDHVVLSRGLDGRSSELEFDFRMVALRSSWEKPGGNVTTDALEKGTRTKAGGEWTVPS